MIENPDVPINTDEGAPHGGFRVSVENNVGTLEPVDDSALDDGGFLIHTDLGNKQRSWTVKWTAPSSDTEIANFLVSNRKSTAMAHLIWMALTNGTYSTLQYPELTLTRLLHAEALTILMTVIGLALGLILVGSMWVFYTT